MYRPWETNIAHTLSRLKPVEQVDHGEGYDFVRAIVEGCVPIALSPNELEETSYNDEKLCNESRINCVPMASFCFVAQG